MGLDVFFSKHTTIGYFRKANFLVAFFEQYGFDTENQIPLFITKNMVSDLISRCKRVLSDHTTAKELLPTCTGFFFGSDNYDECYYSDVKEVLKYCEEKLLPMFDELSDNDDIYFETWY